MTIEIDQIVSLLASPASLPAVRNPVQGIQQPADEPGSFVEPQFEQTGDEPSVGGDATGTAVPSVMLLSAPAAVGKSWLAQALSGRSENPLWDLSRFRLGSHFFTGTLAQVYGGEGYAEIEQRLREGGVTLILDAADEAVVGSGLGNYEAAIADLCGLVRHGQSESASVVILGRPDTLELTGVLLHENGISWRLLTVDYFDEERSRKFVATKIRAAGAREIDEADEFLEDFFETVRAALSAQDVSHKEFLGYAPVLDAIASFYASHPNPFATFQAIKRSGNQDHVWSLLRDVVTAICRRETAKLASTLSDSPDLREFVDRVYSLSEQVRLLTEVNLSTTTIEVPAGLPNPLQQRLVDAWRAQFEEHPFFRRQADRARVQNPFLRFSSVMFRDFLAAERLLDADDVETVVVVGDLLDDEFVASPVLARFLAAGIGNGGLVQAGVIPALLESVAADLTEDLLRLEVEESLETEVEGQSAIVIRILAGTHELAECEAVIEDAAVVELGRSVARTLIDVPQLDVSAPAGRRDLLLGEDVNVVCRRMDVDVEDVRIQSGFERPAKLRASEFDSRSLRIYAADQSMLRVDVPTARHPWHQYVWNASGGDESVDYQVYEEALRFRQIYRWFSRPSITGRLTYPIDAMDKIVAKGRIDWEIFYFLESRGYIERAGHTYRLIEPIPARDVIAVDLASRDYVDFLKRFLAWRAERQH